ncbi:MAG: histidinol-phosphatase [Thermomicrobiales bacterium]|nr:histidinol-phosphatase [Thermomicrobiales bacterium]
MANHPANAPIVQELRRLATVMEIAGENPFRTRAIKTGADAVNELEHPVAVIAATPGMLTTVPGIGSGITALIEEILANGTTASIDALVDRAPAGLVDIVALPGIGAKTAAKLFQLAGVRDINSLSAALESGSIDQTSGLGPKLAEKLRSGLDMLARRSGRTSITVAEPIAHEITKKLLDRIGRSYKVQKTGSVRRWEETVDDVNLLTTAPLELIAEHAEAAGIESGRVEDGAFIGRYPGGMEVVVLPSTAETWGTDLLRTTGPAAHLELLGDGIEAAFPSEKALYASLGLPYIGPEFRQGLNEIEKARSGELDVVIGMPDIQGEIHCHTTWSDGQQSIAEMAWGARRNGYHYLGISDHSHSLGVANGLSKERLLAQSDELRAVSAKMNFPLLHGSEVEVKRDGSLDFDDETLHGLDFVIASTHSGLTAPRDESMKRLDVALSGGRVDLLAHPSGRLIGRREPGNFDWPALYALAAARGVALEINADPARLDLNGGHAREAIEAGCYLAINCDAHSSKGFGNLDNGIMVARRGFVPRDRVLNTWPIEHLREWLASPETRGRG